MNIYDIIKLFFKLRSNTKNGISFTKIINDFFPEYKRFPEAIKEVGESMAYIGYESKEIEKKFGDVREKEKDLNYEVSRLSKRLKKFIQQNHLDKKKGAS